MSPKYIIQNVKDGFLPLIVNQLTPKIIKDIEIDGEPLHDIIKETQPTISILHLLSADELMEYNHNETRPIDIAITTNKIYQIKETLTQHPEILTKPDKNGNTIPHLLAKAGILIQIKELLTKNLLHTKNKKGETPLDLIEDTKKRNEIEENHPTINPQITEKITPKNIFKFVETASDQDIQNTITAKLLHTRNKEGVTLLTHLVKLKKLHLITDLITDKMLHITDTFKTFDGYIKKPVIHTIIEYKQFNLIEHIVSNKTLKTKDHNKISAHIKLIASEYKTNKEYIKNIKEHKITTSKYNNKQSIENYIHTKNQNINKYIKNLQTYLSIPHNL